MAQLGCGTFGRNRRPGEFMANKLFYGDNLSVLRESIADESVDLIYLDPPFNSNANYNVLFKAPSGEQSAAQIEAFEDTWHWNESAERAFDEVVTGRHSDASIMIRAMRSALGENDMMAYLAMMAVRLIELHRVLKPTGSLYLHCDPTASHYLKVLREAFPGIKYEVIGVPKDFGAAEALAARDKHEFQKWAITLIPDAQPWKGGQKGPDTGIDGIVYLRTGKSKTDRAIIEVKGGEKVGVDVVHKLKSVIER